MLSLELRKLMIEIIRRCCCLPFWLARHHSDRTILCDLNSGDLEPGGAHRLCSSGNVAFFEQTRPAQLQSPFGNSILFLVLFRSFCLVN
jgi:hypothetical protein